MANFKAGEKSNAIIVEGEVYLNHNVKNILKGRTTKICEKHTYKLNPQQMLAQN